MSTRLRKTGQQAYELRKNGKSWPEIATITGVLKEYGRGNLLILSQTKAYAKRHKLSWPPQQEGKQA